jgi:hypothetical protein
VSEFDQRKTFFTFSPHISIMRLIFFPCLGLALLGAWQLPGEKKEGVETWTGPVVLNRRPPPPNDFAYREAFNTGFPAATSAPALAVHAPAPALAPATPGSSKSMAMNLLQDDERELRRVINDDIARMKAVGIGMQVPAYSGHEI